MNASKKPAIFISSSVDGLPIAKELARRLEGIASPTLWIESVFSSSKGSLESLSDIATHTDFAIFVFSQQGAQKSSAPQLVSDQFHYFGDAGSPAESNRLALEFGFMVGRLGTSRVAFVSTYPTKHGIPTNLIGVLGAWIDPRRSETIDEHLSSVVLALQRAIASAGAREDRQDEFASCFLSYTTQDRAFAEKLYDDLTKVGVRCWMDAKDLRAGQRIDDLIGRAVRQHDKSLLILSTPALNSPWVRKELQIALEQERTRGRSSIFPLSLDSAVFEAQDPVFESLRERLILDFSKWRDESQYRKAFSHLVRDLAISSSLEDGGKS